MVRQDHLLGPLLISAVKTLRWMVLVALLAVLLWNYPKLLYYAFGKKEEQALGQFVREAEGVRQIAASIIRENGYLDEAGLSKAFRQQAQEWLAANYPEVRLENGTIQPKSEEAIDTAKVYRVDYVLVDEKGRFESTICMDEAGNQVEMPQSAPCFPDS